VGHNACGLQFHAEITDVSIRDWTSHFPGARASGREDMLAHYGHVKEVFHRHGRRLCDNFLTRMKG
jgi:GMP synthase-like glutamine amidotransferase